MFGLSLRRQTCRLPQIIRRFHDLPPSFRERWADMDDEEKARVNKSRKLKRWGPQLKPEEHFLQAFNIDVNRHGIFQKKGSIKLTDWIAWWRRKQQDYLKWSQRYIPERQEILGNDLALAHFILHRQGKIRRKGCKEYMVADDIVDLPSKYEPTWFLEEIDASGTELCYEGLDNFADIPKLKIAAFRNCQYFDEWCLERLVCLCPKLEVLDISDNENITERGLEGLYRAWNLKKLIVTNWGHGAAFELTCLMLEEALPQLQVEIKKASAEGAVSDENSGATAESTVVKEEQAVKQ
ncbi:distal membrane-arm assembly complex protein 2 [Diachasma alloeum]|uniref:distal membrane-arm assembly complex protein 2 n=1 Tax=Diachasma alloeum TaxID=454923 RepID=UPI00073840B3|nr:distal membrane-arm assembly complex protein 2 [Diachasma alloeum]